MKFIGKHKEEIAKALPITNAFGEVIENPEDVEVGTLVYMIGKGVLGVSKKEVEEVKKYREARNKLAHLEVLELAVVDEILKKG